MSKNLINESGDGSSTNDDNYRFYSDFDTNFGWDSKLLEEVEIRSRSDFLIEKLMATLSKIVRRKS